MNAELQPGDSGGPLLDGNGRVIGIDTAASVGFAFCARDNEGYAIPIDRALRSRQIDSGGATNRSTLARRHSSASRDLFGYYRNGYTPGALVDNVVAGGPADRAGLQPGHIIVAIDGTRVSTPASIARLIVRRSRATRSGSRGSSREEGARAPPPAWSPAPRSSGERCFSANTQETLLS